eukprot:Cvel_24814.t1-p1 / transcript=Cvel_24814.t1 / gene=Cvel_24814 / organism=Chromera_velia_CCMP2878 / gene_product=hypothetical protein / transcript_product=hypothetical protein / location=Cvel_scaffold2734:15-2177(-) / protein_length=426 / sequence_SO=supercontig / SO=protein_coding / is_pseudo=false
MMAENGHAALFLIAKGSDLREEFNERLTYADGQHLMRSLQGKCVFDEEFQRLLPTYTRHEAGDRDEKGRTKDGAFLVSSRRGKILAACATLDFLSSLWAISNSGTRHKALIAVVEHFCARSKPCVGFLLSEGGSLKFLSAGMLRTKEPVLQICREGVKTNIHNLSESHRDLRPGDGDSTALSEGDGGITTEIVDYFCSQLEEVDKDGRMEWKFRIERDGFEYYVFSEKAQLRMKPGDVSLSSLSTLLSKLDFLKEHLSLPTLNRLADFLLSAIEAHRKEGQLPSNKADELLQAGLRFKRYPLKSFRRYNEAEQIYGSKENYFRWLDQQSNDSKEQLEVIKEQLEAVGNSEEVSAELLCRAVDDGWTGRLARLLACSAANVDVPVLHGRWVHDHQHAAIHRAAFYGELEAVKVLVQFGASVDLGEPR